MTDEMYTTRQAALYLGVTEADVRLAVRQGKVRAWSMPMRGGLLVRKSDLARFREGANRSSLTYQLALFSADGHETSPKPQGEGSEMNVA